MKVNTFLTAAILLIASTFSISAQHIPDVNFANAIRYECYTCIDANNDLLPPATSLNTLVVEDRMISNLMGIEGFTSLQSLLCSNNQLTSLPNLPSELLLLECNNNPLSSLPILPSGLRYLSCYNNQLTSLPNLPSGLLTLICGKNNELSVLPDLPTGLQSLYCTSTKITALPMLPSGLLTLNCYFN